MDRGLDRREAHFSGIVEWDAAGRIVSVWLGELPWEAFQALRHTRPPGAIGRSGERVRWGTCFRRGGPTIHGCALEPAEWWLCQLAQAAGVA